MATREELLTEAKERGVEVAEDATKKQIQEAIDAARGAEDTEVGTSKSEEAPAPEVPAPEAPAPTPVSEGSEIAAAIATGLAGAVEAANSKKKITITSDPSVKPRFSLVRNKQGEILIRENESNRLSSLQLQSIEEKDKSIQDQEVEEIL